MFVFGYGSLMMDGWEQQFNGIKHEHATLFGYCRSFNKASTVNWGTREMPCPTLGLEVNEGENCVGCAFEFKEGNAEEVFTYLRNREGNSFKLTTAKVLLRDKRTVEAVTAINDTTAHSYIGGVSITKRSQMIKSATGTSGSCEHYVKSVQQMLASLGVRDAAVEELVSELDKPEAE